MFRALMAILFGPLGLVIHDQMADDLKIKRDLEKSKKGYTGIRINGDEAAREEAVTQFMSRYQKQNPPNESNNSRDDRRSSQHPS
jgi:hypothetical protein